MSEVLTPLGARIRLRPTTADIGPGNGYMLELTMVDPTDTRTAEVWLDTRALHTLAEALRDACGCPS